jgi:protein transport protein SEC61 subunit beta
LQSSPRASSPVNSPAVVGASSGRPSSPTPPGGPKTAIRRRAAADQKDKVANARPSSTRAAGAGGSSSTMLSGFPPFALFGGQVGVKDGQPIL